MSEPVTKSRQAIAEEAAEWFVHLQDKPPPRAIKNRFTAWLTASPVHVEEYLAIAKVFGALRHVDPGAEIDIEALADETVVALHGELDGLNQGARPLQPARSRLWASAATVVLALAATLLYVKGMGPEVYTTALGEQRSVLLEDGSMVSLNTSTRIKVAFTDENRQVHLLKGEALFEVEKDAVRPFLVETSSAMIRVTGTQFNVYEQDEGTAVTVLQGEVEVRPKKAARTVAAASKGGERSKSQSRGIANLAVGDQAVVKSGSVEIETRTVDNLEPVTAWTERRLVFDSTPLSDIVKQFNRYNRERLMLEDASLASLELSGVFSSNDPESLVLFLQRISDVEIVASADGTEIRIRGAKAAH